MSRDVFLSYAREDTSKARELVSVLEDEGLSVWWDKEIYPGRDFELEIDQELANAKVVVVLWSSFSILSNWVRHEAKEAKDSNKLIPILLDDSRIPLSFRALNTIALIDWPDKQSLVELASFKSAVRKFLDEKPRFQQLEPKKTDEMTLSVRVASRVAEFVNEKNSSAHDVDMLRQELDIVRCISDISIAIATSSMEDRHYDIKEGIVKLGESLRATTITVSNIDFSNFSVKEMRIIKNHSETDNIENSLFAIVNEYCSQDCNTEFNLDYKSSSWPFKSLLCLPLAPAASCQEYVWYQSIPESKVWTEELQESLLKVAKILFLKGRRTPE